MITIGPKPLHYVYVSYDKQSKKFWIIDTLRTNWSKQKVSYFADIVVLRNPRSRTHEGVEAIEGELLYIGYKQWVRFFNTWQFSLRHKWLREVLSRNRQAYTIHMYGNMVLDDKEYALFRDGMVWV